MIDTKCPICETYGNSSPVYSSTVDEDSFSTKVFSARRLPDRRHYAWVRCTGCQLLRSDPINDLNLGKLYEDSTFDYSAEAAGLAKTYLRGLLKALKNRKIEGSLLEVGGGNSFFLEEAIKLGFRDVQGIEPSLDAVEKTRPDIRPNVHIGLMKNGIFSDESFDVVTMFHVMDHLPDPLATLRSCISSLKQDGLMIVAVHDERSWSARLLGNKSPIFDVEHTFLYSKKTGKRLFEKAGLADVRVWSYSNTYSLAYLVHLIPMPRTLKSKILTGKLSTLLQKFSVIIPLGNIFISGVKC
jgi:SAM-dependent methyltransferase